MIFLNYDNLPTALSQNEICKCFLRFNDGDLNARDDIILHNIRLVINTAMKFRNTGYEIEELVAVGLIGLIKAVNSYNLSKSKDTMFSTYAGRCINNEILMFLRRERKHFYNEVSLDFIIANVFDGKEANWNDILQDDKANFVSNYEQMEANLEIRRLVNQLSGIEKEVTILYFGFIDDKPLTQKEISEKLEISQSYISRVLKKSLAKIKANIDSDNIIKTSIMLDYPYSEKTKVKVKIK